MRTLRLGLGPSVRRRVVGAAVFLLPFAATTGCAPHVCTSRAGGSVAVYMPSDGDLPFSPAVHVGPMIYLSGQIATTPSAPRTVTSGGIEVETRQVMENIKAVLEKNGASMDDIVKCTVMMADMREWPAMNAVYASYFPTHKPARSSFGTSALALGARVEIECTAYHP